MKSLEEKLCNQKLDSKAAALNDSKEEYSLHYWRRNFLAGCALANCIASPVYFASENYQRGALFTAMAIGSTYLAYLSNISFRERK